jgi:alpha-mannosidase
MAFSTPLIPVTSVNSLSEKPLPPEKSFLSLDADDLVLTALKKADGGPAIVLRAFEIQGNTAESSILFLGQQHTFRQANLLEEDTSTGEQKTLHVQPYDIDTLKLPMHLIGPRPPNPAAANIE